MFTRFLFFRVSFCVCLSDFLHPCVSLLHLSSSLYLPLCLCVFFFGPPTRNSRFNSEGFFFFFWLITLGIFPAFERSSLAARSSSISACDAGESHANYPGYWLLQSRGCDLHEVTFSSNVQTFATFFWKTINSSAFSSTSLLYPLFLSLHHSLSLFLWLLSSHKQGRFTAKRVRAVQGGEIVGVFSVASDYLLVNWLLFFVVDIQRGV